LLFRILYILLQKKKIEMTEVEFVPFRLTEAADVYTIRIDGKEKTEFHEFMMTFKNSGDNYLADDFHRILNTLNILTTQGIKEYHFRPEGRFSDRVYALPLYTIQRNRKKHGTLRLYCIRISDKFLILGGGGEKKTQTYEEDQMLSDKVTILQLIDRELKRLEEDGLDVNSVINNLTINI